MNRNQTKISTTESSGQYQRRFISPNQLKSSDAPKTTKIEEYRSSEREPIHSKTKDDPSQRPDKSKSQISSQTPSSRSTTQKDKNQIAPHPERSRSKEKKDYMAANLAKFNRKKDDKLSSSNVSDKSNPNPSKEKKQQRYIYTFKEEIKAKNEQVSQEYAPMPSSIEKVEPSPASSQMTPLPSVGSKNQRSGEEKMQGDSSELRSNNTSVAISSKGKPIEVNVIKYEDRNNVKRQSREIAFRQLPSAQIEQQASMVDPPTTIQSFKKIANPEPLMAKQQFPASTREDFPASTREDFSLRLRRLQSQKQSLQQSTTRLLQQKLQLQGQIAFLNGKCQEQQRELQLMQQAANRNARQIEQTSASNQRMFIELEERYNSLLQEYRARTKQITEMSVSGGEMQARIEELTNALRSAEDEGRIKGMQADKTKRIYEARILQLKQEHQFQLKQIQIRSSEQARQDNHLQQSLKQFERELAAKNRELEQKSAHIEELAYQVRDRDELEGFLHVKETENQQLLIQLNKTKELLYCANANSGEALQKLTAQLKEKEKRIKQLTETVSHVKKGEQMQKLSLSAQSQLYNGGQGDGGSFQEFIRSQSEETNRLRADLAARDELIFRLGSEGDQLRQRLRRVEQEVQLNARNYAINIANMTQVKQATELMLKKRIAALESLRAVH